MAKRKARSATESSRRESWGFLFALLASQLLLGSCHGTLTAGHEKDHDSSVIDQTKPPRRDKGSTRNDLNSHGEASPSHDLTPKPDLKPRPPTRLAKVKYWGYQISNLTPSNVTKLVASKYDMLVLEPTRTEKNASGFDTKGMVSRLHATQGKSGNMRIVIAYINIGQAENWRFYWTSSWSRPTQNDAGNPDFMITIDPDGWSGNYPVAYWDPRWKNILLYNKDSMIQSALADGFDGIYMDWVEGYRDKHIKAAASDAGKNPSTEMIKLISEIRTFAKKENPKFFIIAQNAAGLAVGHPEYFNLLDGFAQEQVYWDGDADTSWNDSSACDKRVPTTGSFSRTYYEAQLKMYQDVGIPVFNCEYACERAHVTEAYTLSHNKGFIPYVTRRPLSQLTTTPPPGY